MQEFILQHLPFSIAIFLIALIALIYGVWWARGVWSNMKNLPCKDHGQSLARHEDKLANMNSTLSQIKGQLDILIRIASTGAQFQMNRHDILSSDSPSLSSKNSPRILNDNGMKIYDFLNLQAFLEKNKDWLIEELEKLNPKSALDVETSANTALIIASSDDRFKDLKDQIYKSPSVKLNINGEDKDYEISLLAVLHVLSIPLRDIYLSRYPQLNV